MIIKKIRIPFTNIFIGIFFNGKKAVEPPVEVKKVERQASLEIPSDSKVNAEILRNYEKMKDLMHRFLCCGDNDIDMSVLIDAFDQYIQDLDESKGENARLRKKITELEKENDDQRRSIRLLEKEEERLNGEIGKKEKEIEELEKRIEEIEEYEGELEKAVLPYFEEVLSLPAQNQKEATKILFELIDSKSDELPSFERFCARITPLLYTRPIPIQMTLF